MEIFRVDPAWLSQMDIAVPRYTSYPTAPQFAPMDGALFAQKLTQFDGTTKPLSLYLHIPFCRSMCLFCGCSVVLNRNPEVQERYLRHLLEEIRRTASVFSQRRVVSQVHFGGGTPTSLTQGQLEILLKILRERFLIAPDAEISIEIDPRTVQEDCGAKLSFLRQLGFNRVSFGVQDLDASVQEAVRRRQSEEMTRSTYDRAKKLQFSSVNIDLIYGLPKQTAFSFARTVKKLLEMRPDRIALYSYAKVPWLKPHQKAIPENDLPSTEEKFRIYVEARETLMAGGYVAIGMDHFSLAEDPIALAYREGKLTRNFQGYSVAMAEDMLGFGMSAIGFLENSFFQNFKETASYEAAIQKGDFALFQGFVLDEDDQKRRWTIQALMCHFVLEKKKFEALFGCPFDLYFAKEAERLKGLTEQGLLIESFERLEPTPLGRLLIRQIASVFDAYLGKGRYSRLV